MRSPSLKNSKLELRGGPLSTDIWRGILLCIQHIKQRFADGFGKTGYKNQHWHLQIHYFGGGGASGQLAITRDYRYLGLCIRKWKARGSGLKC